MSKEMYLNVLQLKLESLPMKDKEDALSYVAEYFDEAGTGNEEQVERELGSPDKFAAQIKADFTLRSMKEPRSATSSRKTMPNLGWIILGILSLPLSFPILLVVFILLFVMGILLIVFGFVFVLLIGIFSKTAIQLFASGILGIFTNSVQGTMTLAYAFMTLGITILILLLAYGLYIRLLPLCVRGLGRLFQKIKGGKPHEIE